MAQAVYWPAVDSRPAQGQTAADREQVLHVVSDGAKVINPKHQIYNCRRWDLAFGIWCFPLVSLPDLASNTARAGVDQRRAPRNYRGYHRVSACFFHRAPVNCREMARRAHRSFQHRHPMRCRPGGPDGFLRKDARFASKPAKSREPRLSAEIGPRLLHHGGRWVGPEET